MFYDQVKGTHQVCNYTITMKTIQSTERIKKRAKPYSVPIFTSQTSERKEFQKYWVDLLTRQSEKKSAKQSTKLEY